MFMQDHLVRNTSCLVIANFNPLCKLFYIHFIINIYMDFDIKKSNITTLTYINYPKSENRSQKLNVVQDIWIFVLKKSNK